MLHGYLSWYQQVCSLLWSRTNFYSVFIERGSLLTINYSCGVMKKSKMLCCSLNSSNIADKFPKGWFFCVQWSRSNNCQRGFGDAKTECICGRYPTSFGVDHTSWDHFVGCVLWGKFNLRRIKHPSKYGMSFVDKASSRLTFLLSSATLIAHRQREYAQDCGYTERTHLLGR